MPLPPSSPLHFFTDVAPRWSGIAAALPAKRKGTPVKMEPTSKVARNPPGIKKSMSMSSDATTEVPAASLSLPHVQMFTDW